jgi:hypothetical protein
MRDSGTAFATVHRTLSKEKSMRTFIPMFALLALVAGCNKGPDAKNPPARADAPSSQAQANTPTTPANVGQPGSQEEKKEGANPQQGQVDPKSGPQRRDFQQQGDQAGPKSADTTPKSGG